jgi:hypothetical protein
LHCPREYSFEEYASVLNSWTSKPDIPARMTRSGGSAGREGLTIGVVNNTIYTMVDIIMLMVISPRIQHINPDSNAG